ncbi:hypothetical protein RN001_011890 [Aquatica leii]|uniref:Caspase-3 n=1 Tax=Aquatica leii TaxID=1421715 RepID=A0AAN7P4T9_9COLE|nr:hypothetical protein RN001_011890 [Aquatica leii]
MFGFKKETKTESKKENVKKSQKSILTSASDGNIVTSSTSMYRQMSTSSHSEITSVESTSTQSLPLQSTSTNTDFSRIMTDATPFAFQPLGPSIIRRSARQAMPPPMIRSQPLRSSASRITSPYNTVNAIDPELKKKVHIKVTKSIRFMDVSRSIVPIYKTRSRNRGYLLLINNIKFFNESERVGAEIDEENLADLFNGLGFKIKKYRNLTKSRLQEKVTKFRTNRTLGIYDIVTVIVMSHGTGTDNGDNTQVVCSDGELLDTTWIINQFDSNVCSQLMGKPKIFIFQCCRGNNINSVQHDSVPITPRVQSDMLIAYSTIPGFLSHRDPKTGTWYIQAICKVFMEHAHAEDVESLLKIVDNKLSSLVAGSSRQTSSFENRGFKTCYLHPQLYE